MAVEIKPTTVEEARYAISLDSFALNGRSAPMFLKSYLCSACAKRVGEKKEPALKVLLTAIQSCCSQKPEFFSEKLPILESTFRLFLHNGNKPLTLSELSSELGRVRAGDIYRTSPETLQHILKNDSFYGIQKVPA
jgi:hypothetical protein